MSDEPQWLVGKATRKSGGSVFVRWLAEQPEACSAMSEAVLVSWSYPESGSRDEVFHAMEGFEELLRPLWFGPSACLALVQTFADSREWTFYTPSPDAFTAEFNRLLSGHPRFPIQLTLESDPQWSRWRKFALLRRKAQPGAPGQRP